MTDPEFREEIENALARLHASAITTKAQIDAVATILERVCTQLGVEFGNSTGFAGCLDSLKNFLIDQELKRQADDFPNQASRIRRILKLNPDESTQTDG